MINMNKKINAPVKWLGHLNHDEVEHYLSNANLALLTSQFEVYPLSIIEAYWAGVPVVVMIF